MSPLRRSLVTLVAVVPLAVTAVGCGGSNESDKSGSGGEKSSAARAFAEQDATEIADAAISAMKSLSSMRARGSIADEDGSQIGIDLLVDADGTCEGSVSFESATAQIIALGDDQYLKGSEAFWAASVDAERGPQIHSLIGDRWVRMPKETTDFSEFCDLDEMLSAVDGDLFSDGEPLRGDVVDTEAGQAIELFGKDDGGTTTLLISTSTPHYILSGSNDGDEGGGITFSDFNKVVKVKVPTGDEIADMSEIRGE